MTDTSGNPPPSAARTGELCMPRLNQVREAAWHRYVTAWMLASTLGTWVLCIATILFTLGSVHKSTVALEGKPSLREAVHTWMRHDIRPDFDQLNLFLSATLVPLYGFEQGNTSFRPLLKGMVSPRILEEADAYLGRHEAKIQAQHLAQFLQLQFADPNRILFDADSRRMSVPLSGELSIVSDGQGKPKIMRVKFEAKAILSANTPSAVNPFPFYLESLEIDGGPA